METLYLAFEAFGDWQLISANTKTEQQALRALFYLLHDNAHVKHLRLINRDGTPALATL